MKKLLCVILAALLSFCACALAEDIMSYQDFVSAEIDDEITIETYVQAHQGWWEDNGTGKVTLYCQSEDGAYFLYNALATQEEAEKLVSDAQLLDQAGCFGIVLECVPSVVAAAALAMSRMRAFQEPFFTFSLTRKVTRRSQASAASWMSTGLKE